MDAFAAFEGTEDDVQAWQELVVKTENAPFGHGRREEQEKILGEQNIEITIAEVLGIGHYILRSPEVTVVKDAEGNLWILCETSDENGLVSRYDVKAGMKFRLRIREIARVRIVTDVFLV